MTSGSEDEHAEESIDRLIAGHHLRYDAEYGGGLSDHGPMVLLAMRGLGLSEPNIVSFHRQYVAKLEPARAVTLAQRPDDEFVRERLGQRNQYPELLAFFLSTIAATGVAATVNGYLPSLLPAWASAAFHPLIRLAYGLESGNAGEIAAGLAYAACIGPHRDLLKLVEGSLARPAVDPTEAAMALRPPADFDPGVGLFQPRLTQALQSGALAGMGPPVGGLEAVATICREIFASTHNFFALHLVTGTHALRICLGHLDAPPPLTEPLALTAVLAAYLAVGAPPFSTTSSSDRDHPGFDSTEFLNRTHDEHDIKIAYSCASQAQAYDDPAYLAAARGYLAPRA